MGSRGWFSPCVLGGLLLALSCLFPMPRFPHPPSSTPPLHQRRPPPFPRGALSSPDGRPPDGLLAGGAGLQDGSGVFEFFLLLGSGLPAIPSTSLRAITPRRGVPGLATGCVGHFGDPSARCDRAAPGRRDGREPLCGRLPPLGRSASAPLLFRRPPLRLRRSPSWRSSGAAEREGRLVHYGRCQRIGCVRSRSCTSPVMPRLFMLHAPCTPSVFRPFTGCWSGELPSP